MVTNDDLKKFRGIVREEIEANSDENKAELKLIRMELSNKVSDLSNRVKNLDIKITKEVSTVSKDIAQIKKEVKKIQKELAFGIKYLDNRILEQRGRVETIEDQLGIPHPLY